MKKPLIIISVTLFVVLAGLISAPFFIDINDYKDQITSLVKEKTGADVKIKGKISFNILPDIALNINDIQILSPIEGDGDLISVSELVLNLQLIPLFSREIEVDSFKLVKPVVSLHSNKEGKSNWILPNLSDKQAEAAGGFFEPEGNIADQPVKNMLRFQSIKIIDGKFSFIDDKTGQKIKISAINLSTSLGAYSNKFDMSAKFDMFEDSKKGKLSLKGKYYLGEQQYGLQDVHINMDGIGGESNIDIDLSSDVSDLKAAFFIEAIDLNNYVLSGTAAQKHKSVLDPTNSLDTKTEDFSWSSEKIDFSPLDKFNAHFNLQSKGITYQDISLGEMLMSAYLRNGKLTLNLKKAELYGGIAQSDLVIDNILIQPSFEQSLRVKNLNLSQMPKAISKDSHLSGILTGEMLLTAAGKSQREIVENLNGKAGFSVSEGSLNGIDLFSMINNVTSSLNINKNISNSTRFDQISGDIKIENGILSNDNFTLKSDVLNFAGEGTVDLPNLSVNYRLTPKFSQDFANAEKAGPKVPVIISGNLLHPVFRLEVKAIVEDLINNPENSKNLAKQLKNDFRDIKKDITKEFNKDMIKDLKGIFNQ